MTESDTKAYGTILVEQDERVGTITLNRPKALNALNSQVMDEVTTAAAEFDNDPGIGAIIITGSPKAFAAGADIKEMSHLAFSDVFAADFFAPWAKLAAVRTPICFRAALVSISIRSAMPVSAAPFSPAACSRSCC